MSHNEKRGRGKFDTHKTNRIQEGQTKQLTYLTSFRTWTVEEGLVEIFEKKKKW